MLGDRAETERASDAELVAAAAGGDENAFTELYDRHVDAAYRLLSRLIGPDGEREDLLQDAFLRAYRALGRYRGQAAFSTFLHRIVVNVAYDHLKRRRRNAPLDVSIDDVVAAVGIDPAESAHRRRQIEITLGYLNRLSPKRRVAYVLREVAGLSYIEIASLVGARPAAVRMRVNKAQKQLEAMIGGES